MPFSKSPGVIAIDGCSVHARCRAASGSRAGGDGLFHEPSRRDGRLLLLLVDVSGHGDPVAPYVELISRRFLTDPATCNLSPSQLLGRLHGMLAPVWAEDEIYVCATAIAPDTLSGSAVVASAGMPPPLLGVFGDTASVWEEAPDGTPLGLPVEETTFDERSLELAGRAALFFTDGVNEAHRTSGSSEENGAEEIELFGFERVQSLFKLAVGGDPRRALVERLFDELAAFVGDDWPQDDTTTLCFEFDSKAVSAK